MKLKCERESLQSILHRVQGIVSSRTAIPILANVMLEAREGEISLTTTDLDVGIRCTCKAEVEEAGATTIPVRRFSGIVKELNLPEITIKVSGENVLEIRHGRSYFKMLGLSVDDFPKLPDFSGKESFDMEQGAFKDMLRKTSYAVSQDETRYALSGVLLEIKEDMIVVVGTDGRRLALIEKQGEFAREFKKNVIIPGKAVNELLRIMGDEGTMSISFLPNQAGFRIGGTLLTTRLIDAHFPNYSQVVPGEAKEKVVLNREEFLSALRRAALLTSERSNSVKMQFSKRGLEITAVSPEIGEAKEEIDLAYEGTEMSIAFNPYYIMECLRNLDDEDIIFEFTDPASPGVIKNEQSFLYVIMPMRVT